MTDKVETKKPKAKAPAKVVVPAKKVEAKKAPVKKEAPKKAPAKKAPPKKADVTAPAKPPVKKKAEEALSLSSLINEAANAASGVSVAPIPERIMTLQEKKVELPTVAPATFRPREDKSGEKISFTDLMAKRGKTTDSKSPFASWTLRSN